MLKANALVSVEEAKAWITVGAGEETKLEDEINRVSEAIEFFCDRPLKKRTFTDVRVQGPKPPQPKLYLRGVPVDTTQALTVTIDGVVQTVWKSESDGDPTLKDVILGSDDYAMLLGQRNHLWRGNGWGCASYANPYNVLLTYTGGIVTTPDDLKGVCFYLLQKLWRERQRGIADVQTVNLPSGSVTLLDIAVPRWAALTLDRYKFKGIGG